MNFQAYLISKKIDAGAFKQAEPAMFASWAEEFEQINPNSFTAQKLYLINPVRRKYQLPFDSAAKVPIAEVTVATILPVTDVTTPSDVKPKQVVPRPAFKPKMPVPAAANNITTEQNTAVVQPAVSEDTTLESGETSAIPTPEITKPAKPVVARPVMKPKVVAPPPGNKDIPPLASADAGQALTKTSFGQADEATLNINETAPSDPVTPPADVQKAPRPVMARPVIKPKVTSPAVPADAAIEKDTTHSNATEQTEPPKVTKPAMARPVIKPPKPKTE